jgi:hypothetical protein
LFYVPISEKSLKIHPSTWKVNPANYFAWEAFCDSLRVFSDSAAIVCLFGGSAIVPTRLSFLSRAPKSTYPYIRRHPSSGLFSGSQLL